jgi:hypothetical protein
LPRFRIVPAALQLQGLKFKHLFRRLEWLDALHSFSRGREDRPHHCPWHSRAALSRRTPGGGFDIRSNFRDTRYRAENETGQLARLTKPYFSLSKRAEIEIRDGEDEELVLAAFVASQLLAGGRQ